MPCRVLCDCTSMCSCVMFAIGRLLRCGSAEDAESCSEALRSRKESGIGCRPPSARNNQVLLPLIVPLPCRKVAACISTRCVTICGSGAQNHAGACGCAGQEWARVANAPDMSSAVPCNTCVYVIQQGRPAARCMKSTMPGQVARDREWCACQAHLCSRWALLLV